jgi:hypothetical protein
VAADDASGVHSVSSMADGRVHPAVCALPVEDEEVREEGQCIGMVGDWKRFL